MSHAREILALLVLATAICASRHALAEAANDHADQLDSLRRTHGVPALGALRLRNGKIEWQSVAGDAPPDAAWHLGSNAKAMTATLAARLVERGAIAWDTTLADGLPELAEKMHEPHRRTTLRQLLAHRGAVIDGTADAFLLPQLWRIEQRMADATPAERRREAARIIFGAVPVGEPGGAFLYSNYGYILAGAMVERAGGDSWENLMRREVFEPLGMTTAGFGVPPTIRGHSREGDKWVPQPRDNPPTLGPAGTVHCNLSDWSKFAAVHLGDGPAELLVGRVDQDSTRAVGGWGRRALRVGLGRVRARRPDDPEPRRQQHDVVRLDRAGRKTPRGAAAGV